MTGSSEIKKNCFLDLKFLALFLLFLQDLIHSTRSLLQFISVTFYRIIAEFSAPIWCFLLMCLWGYNRVQLNIEKILTTAMYVILSVATKNIGGVIQIKLNFFVRLKK